MHLGLVVALAAAVGVWWLLNRSTVGFELRAVGANQFAARTAGMSVARAYILVMLISGALAGLAGTSQILGTNNAITGDIDAGFGFDAITVALLGRANPGGHGPGRSAVRGAAGGRHPDAVEHRGAGRADDHRPGADRACSSPPRLSIRGLFRLREVRGGGPSQLAKGWNG